MGERGFLSTIAALMDDALYDQMRFGEAEHFTRVSEEAAALDDVRSQGSWRSVRAKTLAQRGELEEAEDLAQEAVRLVDGTEWLDVRADFRLCLAHVLSMAGRTKQAVHVLEDARGLYEQKGNPVLAAKAEKLLGQLRRPEC